MANYGTGLDAQIGFGAEEEYGVRVAPTLFLPFVSESLSFDVGRIESNALRAGRRVRSNLWRPGKRQGSGRVVIELADRGLQMLFEHALGLQAVSTPVTGVLTRDYAYTVASTLGLSQSIQVGIPGVEGTIAAYDFLGCKVTDWKLGGSVDEIPTLDLGYDAYDLDLDQALADVDESDFPEQALYDWTLLASFTLDGTEYPIDSLSFSMGNGLKVDRFRQGSALKREPLCNQFVAPSGEVSSDFIDSEAIARFLDGEEAAIVAQWTGGLIEGALSYYIKVEAPVGRTDGDLATVGGPDVVKQPLKFTVLDDGVSEPLTITYRTTEIEES